jgi:hypothetical protein
MHDYPLISESIKALGSSQYIKLLLWSRAPCLDTEKLFDYY